MIEHTYERIIGLICQHMGYQITGLSINLSTSFGISRKIEGSRNQRI